MDANGGPVSTLLYTAFGETRLEIGATNTDYRYTGHTARSASAGGREEPELGLYFYNARWYDPSLGRFIQPDSVVPNPGNPQDWDRYAYVRNNPVNLVDPNGHNPLAVILALVGMAIVFSQIPSDQYQIDPNNWGNPGVMLVGLATTGFLGDLISTSIDCISNGCEPVTLAMSVPPGPNPNVLANVVDDVTDAIPSQSVIDNITIPEKKINQVSKRGWSTDTINDVVSNPAYTRSTRDNPNVFNRANGNPVTYYYRSDGHYVVIDNVIHEVVQISDTKDLHWKDEMTNSTIHKFEER